MADTVDLGSTAFGRAGSSPVSGTYFDNKVTTNDNKCCHKMS